MNRTEAIGIRALVRNAVASKFTDMSTISWHANLATHNNILWKTWRYNQKFCLLDWRLYPTEQADANLFEQSTEEYQTTIKSMADLIAQTISAATGLPGAPVVWTQQHTRSGVYMEALFGDVSVLYFTKNDANGWGRPHIILTIPFD